MNGLFCLIIKLIFIPYLCFTPRVSSTFPLPVVSRHYDLEEETETVENSVPDGESEDNVSARATLKRASLMHAQHDLAGAVGLYLQVVAASPMESDAWDGMGIVLFQQVHVPAHAPRHLSEGMRGSLGSV